jgi:hypothetical protein
MTDYAESITCQWIPGKTGPFGIVRRAAYLSEGLFQHIGRVQPLVGMQQELERLLATYREVLSAREQRVLLPFDVTPLAAGEAGIFALSYLVERFTQVANNMEFIE